MDRSPHFLYLSFFLCFFFPLPAPSLSSGPSLSPRFCKVVGPPNEEGALRRMRGRWDVGPTMAAASRSGGASGGPSVGRSSLGRPGGPPSSVSVPEGPPAGAAGSSCASVAPSASAGARKGRTHPPFPPRYSHAYTVRDTSMRINGLCFSSDGSLLFLSSWDCTLHIHDVRRSLPIRSLHAHRHGIESTYLLPTSNHLCLCPTKLQGPPPQSKQDKQQQQQPPVQGGGPPGAPPPPPAEGVLGALGAPSSSAAGAPPTFGKEGGNTYSLRLWDLRENRYVRVTQVTGRVIPGTGVCVHPKYATYFCCTDDGFVKYFSSDRENCMWKRQTKTRRPLAAIEREGLVGALYEGGGRITLWDLVDMEEPFAAFSVAPYLLLPQHQQHQQQQQQQEQQQQEQQQQEQQQEIPISLNFSPEGSLLIVGTDRGRLLAFNSFTGSPAAVWTPPGGPSFFTSPLDLEGGPFLSDGGATTGGFLSSSSSSSSSSVCNEGFIPAIDNYTGTLFCGSTDGWVYGYDLSQADRGGLSSAAHQRGASLEGPSSSCNTCGGRVASRAGEGGPSRDRRWGGPPVTQHECCCDITFKPSCRVGPHWAPPLWVAANPKYAVVATAGINCSLWKAEIG
ncbi:hypothetical protein Esti_005828 [Eimeria stiedai]